MVKELFVFIWFWTHFESQIAKKLKNGVWGVPLGRTCQWHPWGWGKSSDWLITTRICWFLVKTHSDDGVHRLPGTLLLGTLYDEFTCSEDVVSSIPPHTGYGNIKGQYIDRQRTPRDALMGPHKGKAHTTPPDRKIQKERSGRIFGGGINLSQIPLQSYYWLAAGYPRSKKRNLAPDYRPQFTSWKISG